MAGLGERVVGGGRLRRASVCVAALAVGALLVPSVAPAAKLPREVSVAPGIVAQRAPAGGEATTSDRDSGDTRIIGGSSVSIADYPWQAAIDYAPEIVLTPGADGYQRQFCGGTLVAANVIVSAAHCFFDNTVADEFAPASHFTAITGRTVLSSSEGEEIAFGSYYYLVDSNTGQQLYDPNTSVYDVVWIILETPSSTGSPVLIAGADEADSWAPGSAARISGWGNTSQTTDSYPDDLRAAETQIVADETCASQYAAASITIDSQTMLCAGLSTGGVDTCQGDSGGPMVVSAPGGTRLVGDTSFGIGCALAEYPGVYGRVAGEPLRSALQAGIEETAGVDVVGDSYKPKPKLKKKPKKKTTKRKATFRFTTDEPATFKCKLDKKKARTCKSPAKFNVGVGKHKMQIKATDTAGKTGKVKYSWKVEK